MRRRTFIAGLGSATEVDLAELIVQAAARFAA
jgi:hypothetical protein